MAQTLTGKTVYALFWSFLETMGQQVIQFAISVVLARLLLPAEFGLVGMLSVFIAMSHVFLESGFGSALIQKKDIDHVHECSVFYFNLAMGCLIAILLSLTAPYIAAFYGEPQLVALTRFLSINFVIVAFALVQSVLMSRKVQFKTLVHTSLTATVLSGVIGIALAVQGFGVWSLAIQSVSFSLFRCALLWMLCPWRPTLTFSFGALKEMFGFSSYMLLATLSDRVFRDVYMVVIGKIFTATDLGYYSRAQSWQRLTSHSLSGAVARVTFPVFSSIGHDTARFKRGAKKAVAFLAFINFPIMIGLLVTARPAVLLLLTEKWEESIYYLQLFTVLGLLYPFHSMNVNIIMAKGRSDLLLRIEVVKKLLIVANIAITYRWGIAAMIQGQIVCSILAFYINSYYNAFLIEYSIWEQVQDFLPYLGASLLMGAATWSLAFVGFESLLLLVVLQIALGFSVYSATCYLFKLPPFMEILEKGARKVRDKLGGKFPRPEAPKETENR